MKIDLTANRTMKRLAHMPAFDATSPEGIEVTELLEGLQLERSNDNFALATFSYILGQHQPLNLNGEESLLLRTFRDMSDVERVKLWEYMMTLEN